MRSQQRIRRTLAWFACIAAALLCTCSERATPRAPGPIRAVVSIAPLAGIVRPLLPDDAEVRILIPPGRSEHGFEMTPSDVEALRRADLIVYVGLGLEPGFDRFLSMGRAPHARVIAFGEAVGAVGGPSAREHEDHTHDDHEAHTHGGVDPHVWLDPVLVEQLIPVIAFQIQAIMDSGVPVPPRFEAEFPKRVDESGAAVADRHREWADRLRPFAGRSIVTHHAAWGRFADRYGLRVAAVIRPIESAEPTPARFEEAVAAIRNEGARGVFFEPQFDAKAAERIAEAASARLGRLDPLGDGDWFAMMDANVAEIVRILGD